MKIPSSSPVAGPSSSQSKTTPKSPPTAAGQKPAVQTQPNTLDGLFDAAGLGKRVGQFCPTCDAPFQTGAVLCVKCGLHFAEGTKLDAFQTAEKKQFGNKRLNEAADMMAREVETEKRLLGVGTPWWFMFAALAGLIVLIGGILIKMDAGTSGNISSNPLMAKIQKANLLAVLLGSLGAACALINSFAYIALIARAFRESSKQGLLTLFVPLYIIFYMFSRIKIFKLGSTVTIFWLSLIVAGASLAYALPRI